MLARTILARASSIEVTPETVMIDIETRAACRAEASAKPSDSLLAHTRLPKTSASISLSDKDATELMKDLFGRRRTIDMRNAFKEFEGVDD